MKVRTEGFGELRGALGELKKATQTNVKKRVLMEAAEPIAEDARRRVPVGEGRLRDAIEVTAKQPSPKRNKDYYGVAVWVKKIASYRPLAQAVSYAGRRGQRGEKRDYAYGSTPEVYGRFVEFGTSRQRAFPFLRPAWVAEGGQRALDRIKTLLKAEIAKAVARAQRKAMKGK